MAYPSHKIEEAVYLPEFEFIKYPSHRVTVLPVFTYFKSHHYTSKYQIAGARNSLLQQILTGSCINTYFLFAMVHVF
jgi:hypothetical protein